MTIKKKEYLKFLIKKNCKLYLKSMYIMHISDSNSDFYYFVLYKKKKRKEADNYFLFNFLINRLS